MTLAILAFAAGVVLLQLQPALPGLAWALVLPLLAAGTFWNRKLGPLLAIALGFCWALGLAHLRLAERLAPELEGRDIAVVGVISGLPAQGERSLRFEFEPESADVPLPKRILLSWYRSPFYEEQPSLLASPIHPGERWKLVVRLRRPHGTLNPHGFDYEAWLLERGIGATGYVRGKAELLGSRNGFMDRIEKLRETVRDRFKQVLGETPASGILAALAVGDQRAISAEEWRLFNRRSTVSA